jgi:large subunit ribosomal protein L4
MLSVPIYNRTGEKVGEESIDPAHFGGEVNKQLLHEVVLMHRANSRVGTVNTRGRSDVAGSTKKMYRQKGTGNARMGAKRTNKRVGGGVAFARRNRDYSYSLPKRAVRAAIRMALLSKFQDGQALVVEGLEAAFADGKPRTKPVAAMLRAIARPDFDASTPIPDGQSKAEARRSTLDGRTVLIGLPAQNPVVYRSARNIEGVKIAPVGEFNTYDILRQRYLVLTREALDVLKQRVSEPVRRRPEPTESTSSPTPSEN